MSVLVFAIFYLVMFVIAMVFSAMGVGGGVLYTPVQILFGFHFQTAAATSLFLIMVTSFSATLVFRKAGVVDWPMALVLESSTTLGAFLGGLFSGHFSGRSLTYLFAGVITFAAFFMVKRFETPDRCAGLPSSFFRWRREIGIETYCVNLAVALPIAFIAGVISGLIGVSGGILKVPMLVLLFGVPMNIAVGSSAFMVGLTASGGFLGHLAAGHFDWRVTIILVPGIFLGGQIGARASVKVDKAKMKRFFGYVLFALAIFLVIRTALH
ncbi:MAG TPA: sulfite exporter TauE/SafE family protein [Terriglobia bacterium]|nr:sulfite exporter TauE/SafE family protein [Terriglobia bacterium]